MGQRSKQYMLLRPIDVSNEFIDEIVAYVGKAHTAEIETNHLFIKLRWRRVGPGTDLCRCRFTVSTIA